MGKVVQICCSLTSNLATECGYSSAGLDRCLDNKSSWAWQNQQEGLIVLFADSKQPGEAHSFPITQETQLCLPEMIGSRAKVNAPENVFISQALGPPQAAVYHSSRNNC
jgi:hypothetical protein